MVYTKGYHIYPFGQQFLVAIGANLDSEAGRPERALVRAVEMLPEIGLKVRRISRFYRTPCFPAGAGPDYVNAAVAGITDLAPEDVLAALHDVEARIGRVRTGRWESRIVDLDLLALGDQIRPDREVFLRWANLAAERQMSEAPENIVLPHPRIQDRAFVLVPLRDIAADWVHPVLGRSVRDMCGDLPPDALDEIGPM